MHDYTSLESKVMCNLYMVCWQQYLVCCQELNKGADFQSLTTRVGFLPLPDCFLLLCSKLHIDNKTRDDGCTEQIFSALDKAWVPGPS